MNLISITTSYQVIKLQKPKCEMTILNNSFDKDTNLISGPRKQKGIVKLSQVMLPTVESVVDFDFHSNDEIEQQEFTFEGSLKKLKDPPAKKSNLKATLKYKTFNNQIQAQQIGQNRVKFFEEEEQGYL